MHIKDHFLRFLLPFAFAPADAAPVSLRNFQKSLETGKGDEADLETGRLWEPLPANSYDRYSEYLLPFFRNFLSGQADPPACLMLGFSTVFKQQLLAVDFYDLWFQGQRLPYQVALMGLELVLFNSGVGLVSLELRGTGDGPLTPQDLARVAWHLRHLDPAGPAPGPSPGKPESPEVLTILCPRRYQQDPRRLTYLRIPDQVEASAFPLRPGAQQLQDCPACPETGCPRPCFTLPELLRFCLKGLPQAVPLLDKYLLGAHYVRTDPYPTPEIGQKLVDLFHLRRMYKDIFLASERDLDLEDNPEVTVTFENITFGQSLEGGIILVEDSGDPFFAAFDGKARYNYFMPYLLALHQRFALIHFAINLAALNETDLATVRRLRESAFHFVLRWRFGQVSHTTMYNRVYEKWRQVLGLEELLQEIKGELEELDELLERQSREEEARREKAVQATLTLLNLFTLPILLTASIFGMNVAELADGRFSWWSPRFWLTFGLIFGIIALGFWGFQVLAKYRRKTF